MEKAAQFSIVTVVTCLVLAVGIFILGAGSIIASQSVELFHLVLGLERALRFCTTMNPHVL